MRLRYAISFLLSVAHSLSVFGTHNRAGEITYKQIDALSIEITITTYTKTSSSAADRDSLEVFWGDGTSEFVRRLNGSGSTLPNDVKVNKYIQSHTYPGRGTYTIYFLDPNRVGNILNINYPNSIDVPFFLSTTFTLLNTQFQGRNNSAILLQPPIDIACVGEVFIHNPSAFDPDGDSLAYFLVPPRQGPNEPVPNYKYPQEVLAGPNNKVSLNPITGDFVWESPPQVGDYNIAIEIREYRKGVIINSIIRDMQIQIVPCDNKPPIINTVLEICVVAGTFINIPIAVDDPDPNQTVLLTATGGPFVVANPASLIVSSDFQDVPFSARFQWQTDCNHPFEQYYQVVFRAVDDHFGKEKGLATFHTLRIKVVAPAPQDLKATVSNSDIILDWELPYTCQDASNNFFQGFSIWRKQSPNPFEIDTCITGLDGRGYEQIVFITKQNDGLRYFHVDKNLNKSINYCYRIQAEFALLTESNNLYNRTESLPTYELCIQIARDIPLLTKVSIATTDSNAGTIDLRWTKPIAAELDTIKNPGPYRVDIRRRPLGSALPFEVVTNGVYNFPSLTTFTDTVHLDQGLNTLEIQYEYRLDFYTNGDRFFGSSDTASSVFLTVDASDRRLNLNWNVQTPWTNVAYEVYRANQTTGVLELLTVTNQTNYIDGPLINGTTYCYRIQTQGSYNLPMIENPILNWSQYLCATPNDNVAPCPPKPTLTNPCDNIDEIATIEDLYNQLNWVDPNISCELIESIKFFKVYFTPKGETESQLIATLDAKPPYQYTHPISNAGLAGCYSMTSIDQLGNESLPGPKACAENCPLYQLPNTFTPNRDGANDIFTPTRNLFISSVDIKIYNEWGNLVLTTTDPNINWDGTLDNKGEVMASDGTYYYICNVYYENGNTAGEVLKGYIHLLR